MKHSKLCKALALLLSVLLLSATVFFCGTTAFLGYSGAYTGGYAYASEQITDAVLYLYAGEVAHRAAGGQSLTKAFSENNFYYSLTQNGVRNKQSNFNGQPFGRNIHYTVRLGDTHITADLYEKAEYTHTDLLSISRNWTETAYALRFVSPILAVCSFLFWCLVLVFLFSAAGHRKGEEKPMANRADRLPLEIHALFAGVSAIAFLMLGVFLLEIATYNVYYSLEETVFIRAICGCGIFLCCVTIYLILLGFLLSIATRIKLGTLFTHTLTARLLRLICRVARTVCKKVYRFFCAIPLVWKTAVFLCAVTVTEGILLICNLHEGDNLLLLWTLEKLLLLPAILCMVLMLRKLKCHGEAIAAGELTDKLDTRYMPSDLRIFGQTLDRIGDGLGRAVEARVKSERMKTELITNVSHDIKTPLTSIVNYVDLIKKEDLGNGPLAEYVDVLDRQSARLKKLIEDLIEASKASAGTLTVVSERCELAVLLEQSLGEYGERLSDASLTPVLSLPEESVAVMADGKRLWRVLDNLLGNICKYAQENTRVYISLTKEGSRAAITFRNISRDPLNISADELTARFVRGDASRNTEGSGLGLSIARGLTELMSGKLSLSIDGDLFKATVEFETIE